MDDACTICKEPLSRGKHGLSAEDAESYPQAFCPRCSGLGVLRCVTATKYHYHCSCSVWWTEPIGPR